MGERKSKLKEVVVAVKGTIDGVANHGAPMSVVTPGGRIQVKWDTRANATAMGQLAFFAEFLEVGGLFEHWVAQCPLHYSSPNAPKVRDVLGTWLLSILDGRRRYAHVASLRGDAVAPRIWEWIASSATKVCVARWRISPQPRRQSTATNREQHKKRNFNWPNNGWIKLCWKACSMP